MRVRFGEVRKCRVMLQYPRLESMWQTCGGAIASWEQMQHLDAAPAVVACPIGPFPCSRCVKRGAAGF